MKIPCENSPKGYYYLDGYLKSNLDLLKKAVDKKWDGVLLFDGQEGSGKTVLATTCAKYVDPSFNLDRIVFTQEQFFEAVDNAQPGTAIVWDEFLMGGLSTEATSGQQNALIKKTTTIRKKRLFIFFVCSWFFMIRRYFAIGRSRALINIYSPDGINRGAFKFYSFKKKKSLYLISKKEFSYSSVKPDFYGSFLNTLGYFFSEKQYDDKKEAAIQSLTGNINSNSISNAHKQRDVLMYHLNKFHNMKGTDLSQLFEDYKISGLKPRRCQKIIRTTSDAFKNVSNL